MRSDVLSRSFAATLVLLVGVLGASTALADVRTEARRHFRSGMALIAEGQVDEGVAELLEAYEILPHPNVLYNVGRAYAESGNYADAIVYFERYLETDPPDRAEVSGFLQALQVRIAAIEAAEQPETAAPEPSEPAAPPTAAPMASEEEIAALEDSATQIDALAESTQSDALRQRATTLREIATGLRQRRPLTESPEPDPSESTDPEGSDPPEGSGPSATAEESSLVLGAQREGDTYEETVVSSSRAAQSPLDAPNATTIITEQDVRLSGLPSTGELLRRVPGVDLMTLSPGNTQMSVRGLNQRLNNRAIILVDGRSLYYDFIGANIWNLFPFNPEDIERIEVIRGPASAVYGADALTGVVNILTRQLGEGRSYLSGGIGTNGQYRVAAGITERVDRVRFRLSGGYEQAEVFSRNVSRDRVDVTPYNNNEDLGFGRTMFNGELQVRLADGYSIRAGTGVTSGFTAFQGLSRIRELYMQDALFAQTFVQVNTAFGLSARAFWNHLETDHGFTPQRLGGLDQSQNLQVDRHDVIDGELVYTNSFTIVEGIENQIIGGIGYRFKEVSWPWISDPITGSPVRTQNHGNLFLQDTLRIEDVVQIVVSARGDLHPLFDEPQFSPRGSVLVHPTPRQTIRLSAGTAFRAPTFIESYANVPNQTPLRGITALGAGNENLNPERLVSVELGYMLQEFEFFQLEVTGYYNVFFDQILFNQPRTYRLWDFANTPRAAYNPDLAAFALGELGVGNEDVDFQQIGGEVGVRVYPIDGLDIYANYAIHETAPLGDAQTLDGRQFDQRTSVHKVNAGVQYRSPFGLDIAADFHFVSDQVWVEQVLDTERGGTLFIPFELPAFAVLNARIGWRIPDLDDQVEISVVGTNLLMDGHREHPFGQRIDRRFMGNVTFRW